VIERVTSTLCPEKRGDQANHRGAENKKDKPPSRDLWPLRSGVTGFGHARNFYILYADPGPINRSYAGLFGQIVQRVEFRRGEEEAAGGTGSLAPPGGIGARNSGAFVSAEDIFENRVDVLVHGAGTVKISGRNRFGMDRHEVEAAGVLFAAKRRELVRRRPTNTFMLRDKVVNLSLFSKG
jgi:hypothetical protein